MSREQRTVWLDLKGYFGGLEARQALGDALTGQLTAEEKLAFEQRGELPEDVQIRVSW